MQIGVGSQKAARIERRAQSKGIGRDSRTGVSRPCVYRVFPLSQNAYLSGLKSGRGNL